tara:strand:+ start:79 stop:1476 length:1398 start_codon:yes stop_codon:yes gene_type:complete
MNIPKDEFTVDVDERYLLELIEEALEKAGNPKKLWNELKGKCCLAKYKQLRFSDVLRKWQKKKRAIFYDYYLAIGEVVGKNNEELNFWVNEIRLKNTRNGLKQKLPIKVNPNWCYLSEGIKVEGHLNKKRVIFENTDTALTGKIKKHLQVLGIDKWTIKETLHIRIQVPIDFKDESIEIIDGLNETKIKSFHSRILKLRKGDKKEIIFIQSTFQYNHELIFRLYYEGTYIFKTYIFVPKKGKIFFWSTLEDERYENCCVSLRLDIHNKTLSYILNSVFKIPYGKKTKKIYIPEMIKRLDKEYLRELVSVVIDSEAGFSGNMCIYSKSEKYLNDFSEILLKFNITSKVKNNTLNVFGKRNLEKIRNNFALVSRNKIKQLKSYDNIRNKSPKGMSLSLYLKSLNELGIGSWVEIREKAKRVGNSSRIYRDQLLENKYIEEIREKRPKTYQITAKGKKYLNNNKIYWI